MRRLLLRLGNGARVSIQLVDAVAEHVALVVAADIIEALLNLNSENESRRVQGLRARRMLMKPSAWVNETSANHPATEAQRPEVTVDGNAGPEVA